MKKQKHIVIVGAGPGGLAAAMILAHRGFKVSVFEKDARVGGRSQCYELDGYKFDAGPTFLMMKFIIDEVFKESGANIDEYLKFTRLNPMYRLQFQDLTLDMTDDPIEMQERIEKIFGEGSAFFKFIEREKKRFWAMYPCLQKSYHQLSNYLDKDLVKAMPRLSLGKSMYDELSSYFEDERLKLSFTFQSKYLGMSPWECPAAFMIIPYIEHAFGIYHVEGGLSQINEAMAKVAEENGAKIHLKKPVKKLIIQNGATKGVELENGEKIMGDEVIINADFSYAMTHLAKGKTKKYTPKKLEKKRYSCSTFMMYLGIDGEVDLPHHSIIFSKDYKAYADGIFDDFKLNEDLSFYIRNASTTDKTIAPKGKSNIYILVPVPNNRSGIDWEAKKESYRKTVIKAIENRLGIKDLEKRIEVEKIMTPTDWETDHNVHIGATFNLAHNLGQMLYLRPRNKFEEFENTYLVGGGTHPGSGLPTIWESARITSNLICRENDVPFFSHNPHV